MNKSPAFQFYPEAFLSDDAVELMSPEALGGYVRLLCHAWKAKQVGYLPNDDVFLAQYSRLGDQGWLRCRSEILRAFKPGKKGTIFQKRLVSEWKKQVSYRKAKSIAGKASAESKKKNKSTGVEQVLPVCSDSVATKFNSVSVSVSVDSSENINTPARLDRAWLAERWAAKPIHVLMPDAMGIDDVARKLEAYAEAKKTTDLHGLAALAIDAFSRLVDSWNIPAAKTPAQFTRHWESIQTVMAGRDLTKRKQPATYSQAPSRPQPPDMKISLASLNDPDIGPPPPEVLAQIRGTK